MGRSANNVIAFPARQVAKHYHDVYRQFEGAENIDGWLSRFSDNHGDINHDLAQSLTTLRSRARDLELNNSLASRYLDLCESNIVGHQGFSLQVRGTLANGSSDSRGNHAVESAWRRWSNGVSADIAEVESYDGILRAVVRAVARDGEAIIRIHDLSPTASNPFGFAIEHIDPARLDINFNRDAARGANQVRLGIELAPSGRRIAYHLIRHDGGRTYHERVLANDILHIYRTTRPNQLRGFTWLSPILKHLRQIAGYREAAMVAARVGAAKMGFYVTPEGQSLHAISDGKDDAGEFIDESKPGHFQGLPHGWDFKTFDPAYPHAQYETFMRESVRQAAAGLDVSYHALSGDLTDVNFSSIRQGALDERDSWMKKQSLFTDKFHCPIYHRFLRAAAVNKQIATRLSVDQIIHRYSNCRFQGRRWQWVDPKKDMEAALLAIGAGLKSPQQVAADLGVDPHAVLEQTSAFIAAASKAGVTLDWSQNPQPAQPEDATE